MADEKPKKKKAAAEPKVEAPSGLGISVSLTKALEFGGERLIVKVVLTQDGKEIASDSDFVKI